MADLVREVGTAGAELMFELLLRQKVGTTGDFMPEAWAALLDLASGEEQRHRWLDKMTELAPAIIEDLSDLREWLSQDRDLLDIIDRLPNDFVPLNMATRIFGQTTDQHTQEQAIIVLKALLLNNPPRLYATCDHIIALLETAVADATAQRAEESERLPVTMRSEAAQAFTLGTPSTQRGHVGLHPGLVDEHQPARIEAGLEGTPAPSAAGNVGAGLLKGEQR